MLWTKDSDLELFVTLTDRDANTIDVTSNWISIEVKVGKMLFKAESNPLARLEGENGEIVEGSYENCYITSAQGKNGIMVVIPSESLDFGTMYIRTCTHEVNEHYPDGFKDVWSIWLPCDLAIITEKGFNQ